MQALPALTSEMLVIVSGVSLDGGVPGSRTLTWLPFLVMDVLLQVSAQAR